MIARLVLTAVLLALTLDAYALGDQEVLYVRPAGACAFSGDGTAYTCAASTNAVGARVGLNNVLWSATDGTATQVDPNDILYVCGTHSVTNVDVSSRIRPSQNGNANDGYMIVDGRCPNDPGTISGGGTGARLAWLDDRSYIHVRYMTFRETGSLDYTISGYNQAAQDNDRFLIIEYNNFLDNLLTTAIVWLWGAHFEVNHNYFDNNNADTIYFKGGRDVGASYNVFRRMGTTVATSPDCIQFDSTAVASTGTTILNYNDCDKSGAVNLKYGILAADRTGYTEIIGNRIICPGPSTSPSGCSPILTGHKPSAPTGEFKIHSNYLRYGWRGLTFFAGCNEAYPAQIIGNDIAGAGTLGIWLHSTVDCVLIANNTIVGNGILNAASPASGAHGLYIGKPDTTAVQITNNIFYGNYRGYFFTGTFGTTSSHNDYYGQVSWNIDSGSSQSLEASALTVDPKFINVATSDHRLDGPSTLRRAGVAVTECIDLNHVHCTSTPDIGAYQAHHGGKPTGTLSPNAAGVR